jgi:ABC1 atypical kinase-like domain
VAAQVEDDHATTTATEVVVRNQRQQQEEQERQLRLRRTQEISQLLCDRHQYVMDGHRSSDFAEWVRGRGEDGANVFSMHGVDVNFEIDELHNMELAVEIHPPNPHEAVASASEVAVHNNNYNNNNNKQQRKDPFLPDRMNLNHYRPTLETGVAAITATGREGKVSTVNDGRRPKAATTVFYGGPVHDWDETPPTALQLALRAVRLSLNFAPVVTTSWLAVLSRRFRRDVWYRWIATCLATSGAAFIKYGQWSSTRPDMFPVAFCDALSVLHNSAPAHSWNFTQEQVESSLDIPRGSLLDVFERFDERPLASGSIAQIHVARLRNGQTVAAKVRHPNVAELIDMDFRLMTMLASACDYIPGLRWLHVRDSVMQFSHTMAAQAHLNVEAHHLEVLNHNFRSWKHVRFPRPFFATQACILETFERGRIVTDVLDVYDDEAREMGDDSGVIGSDLIPIELARFIVSVGLSLYLKMLLIDGVMHADLHPGNMYVNAAKHAGSCFLGGQPPRTFLCLVDLIVVPFFVFIPHMAFGRIAVCWTSTATARQTPNSELLWLTREW